MIMTKFFRNRYSFSKDGSKDDKDSLLKADFIFFPNEIIKSGDKVVFTNCSENATMFVWNFGNENISTDENPSQVLHEKGEITISLIAMNDKQTESIKKTIVVS